MTGATRMSGKTNAPTGPAGKFRTDVAAVLAGILESQPGVEHRRTFGVPAYYTRGKMFACVYGDGIALKLPPERIEELPPPVFGPFSPGPMTMGGWVAISRGDATGYRADADLVEEARSYVADLARAAPPRANRPGRR
jgi:hypothetical protein